jgi:hypothetical protein
MPGSPRRLRAGARRTRRVRGRRDRAGGWRAERRRHPPTAPPGRATNRGKRDCAACRRLRAAGGEDPFAQFPPVHPALIRLGYEILLHAAAGVDALFVVQVVGGAAGGDFDNQVGRTFDVVVAGNARAPAVDRFEAQEGIGLMLILQVEQNRRVIAPVNARRCGAVHAQPGNQDQVQSAVLPVASW